MTRKEEYRGGRRGQIQSNITFITYCSITLYIILCPIYYNVITIAKSPMKDAYTSSLGIWVINWLLYFLLLCCMLQGLICEDVDNFHLLKKHWLKHGWI